MDAQIEQNPSGVVEVLVTEARARMAELVNLVEDGQFIYLTRHGKRVAALMPADVAENYEHIEDDYWARRVAEIDTTNTVSMDQVIADVEGGGE